MRSAVIFALLAVASATTSQIESRSLMHKNMAAQIAAETSLKMKAETEAKEAEKQRIIDEAVSKAMAENKAESMTTSKAQADWDQFKQSKGISALAQTSSKAKGPDSIANAIQETQRLAEERANKAAQIRTHDADGNPHNLATMKFQEKRLR